MKIIYMFLAGCMLLAACTKDSENKYTKMVTPIYPVITLKGAPAVTLPVGSGAYTDAGATSYDSTNNSTTTLTPLNNDVDPATAGFYVINFLAKNTYGYRASASRLVLVTTIPASDDISGTYKRTNGVIVHVAKAGQGLYTIDNVGGVANAPAQFLFPYYIGFTDLNNFEGPTQNTPLGGLSLAGATIIRSGSNITLKYVVINPNFGGAVRTFEKQ